MSSDHIDPSRLKPALEKLLQKAKHYGADKADALMTQGRSLHVTVRGGAMEDVDNSESKDVGLRVFVGQRQACVSSSDLSEASLDKLAERAVSMAKLAPEDPYCGLANEKDLETSMPDFELFDETTLTPQDLLARAGEIEKATLSVKGVTQAEGSSSGYSNGGIYFMTSEGFHRGWRSSRHSLSGLAIVSENGAMERDYDSQSARWFEDLKSPDAIGLKAAERATARIGAKQMASGQMPILFDKRVSGSILGALLGAINGNAITRGTSFLKDMMGEQIFAGGINIIDDPTRKRGHGSRPWDGEGVKVSPLNLVENGILRSWLLNTSAAKQLELSSTGHATRGLGSPPGISSSNVYMQAGSQTPAELMKDVQNGLLIMDMFGPSLNGNTGDYSVGVAGFKIENGEITHPVNEITVAGNMKDMFKSLTPANDLEFNKSTVAPTLRIEGMTLAGS